MQTPLQVFDFDCPRTCPHFERQDVCRFNAIFDKLGSAVVNSHTVKIKTEFRDDDTLAHAVRSLGGQVLGRSTHKLYERSETGFGFTLPGWRYPLVVTQDGQLAYDDYRGSWGNVKDLDRLKSEYVLATAEQAAMQQGWLTQRDGETLTVFHPTGGTLVVTPNGAEANGFLGSGCHDALMALNLPMDQWQAKPEFSQVACEIQQGAG